MEQDLILKLEVFAGIIAIAGDGSFTSLQYRANAHVHVDQEHVHATVAAKMTAPAAKDKRSGLKTYQWAID